MGRAEDEEATIEDGQSTPGYPPGTPGYSGADDKGDADAAASEPFWRRLGYESFRAYINEQNRLQTLYEPLPRGSPVPAVDLPGGEVGEVGAPAAPEKRLRQVNVKLGSGEGQHLDQAARIYGLAPATLARALVNRGVKAILEANGYGSD
ncbi:MAG: hypothetical protein QOI10_2091 [Solirubrobacterales bacterium]|jgi:hypothetical protein|nr:hypothetical protein [Solirubrobacterales bacterium]